MTTLTPSGALTSALDAAHLSYELIPHRRTESAAAEARAMGLDPSHVAKTLVLVTDDGFVRAVLPASERIDLARVREVVGAGDVRLASEQALIGAYPDFELGAVPPVGGTPDRVLVDRRLSREPTIVFEAGTHEHSVRLRTADLVAVTGATVADICQG
jgi:Ala-tRNA(Pro) deacylase